MSSYFSAHCGFFLSFMKSSGNFAQVSVHHEAGCNYLKQNMNFIKQGIFRKMTNNKHLINGHVSRRSTNADDSAKNKNLGTSTKLGSMSYDRFVL